MFSDHLILAILWLLYCLLHSVLASRSVKTKLQQGLGIGKNNYRLGYNLFALLSLVALILGHLSVPSIVLFNAPLVQTIGSVVLLLTGGIIMFICIKKYFLQLSGLRKLPPSATAAVLETGGIHRFVRHPLYLGTFIFLAGLLLLFPLLSNFIAVLIIIVYTMIGIRYEENKLIAEFGEFYRSYQKKVPRIIPFLK
jgi:protein-S-isoprenylcysteine O-methyltransferase Ste14